MVSTTGDGTARFLWSRARTAYGATLRILPDPAADHLRSVADRIRHLIPDLEAGQGSRIPVPGRIEDPVVLLVALGCDGDRLERLAEHLRGCAARLVWLVDTDDPALLAAHVVEWMAPAATIQRAGFDPTAVRSARLSTISERYRPHRVVVVGPVGPLPDPILVAFRATGDSP